jgi:hypothetical protein
MVIDDVLMENKRVESRAVAAEYLVSWVREVMSGRMMQ